MSDAEDKAAAVGKRIAIARERKGYSQAELASLIGVSAGAIGQYETGRNLPRLKRLESIALETGTSTEWLLTGDEPDELVRAQTKTEEALLRLIRAVPVDQHPNVLAMIEGLASRYVKKAG